MTAAHAPFGPAASRKELILSVLAILALWTLLRTVFFEGFHGTDDLEYISFAAQFNHHASDHLEARLLYEWLVHTSIGVVGDTTFAWAFPGLLGSLMLLVSGMAFAFRECGYFAMVATGLILASLSLDITAGTVPNPYPLGAGLAAIATCFALQWMSRPGLIAAGVVAGLSILVHPIDVFYVGALALAVALTVDWRRAARLLALALGVYAVGELSLSAAVNGDPLLDLKILQRWHDPDVGFPLYSAGWFLAPLKNLIFSKDWGILPVLALAAGVWQRSTRSLRALTIALAAHWLWIAFGSAKPTAYEPFWRLTHFEYPAALAMAVLCGTWLAKRRRWFEVAALASLNVVLVASSGSYGQADDISRDFLTYARAHAQDRFVVDSLSMREMEIYNRFQPVANVSSWDAAELRPQNRPTFLFFNPLNNEWAAAGNRPGYVAPAGPPAICYGAAVWKTPIQYRKIAVILPDAIRKRSQWFVRRPAGYVFPVRGLTVCGPMPVEMQPTSL